MWQIRQNSKLFKCATVRKIQSYLNVLHSAKFKRILMCQLTPLLNFNIPNESESLQPLPPLFYALECWIIYVGPWCGLLAAVARPCSLHLGWQTYFWASLGLSFPLICILLWWKQNQTKWDPGLLLFRLDGTWSIGVKIVCVCVCVFYFYLRFARILFTRRSRRLRFESHLHEF